MVAVGKNKHLFCNKLKAALMKYGTTNKPNIMILASFYLGIIVLISLSSCSKHASLSPRCRSALDSLMQLLPQREAIIARQKAEIDSTAKAIATNKTMSPSNRFYAYKMLFFKSHLFTVNHSIQFSRKMADVAESMNDPARRAEAMTYYGYSLARSGLFKEGVDTLSAIHIDETMPDSVLYTYYAYYGRAYHDLASYGASAINGGTFSKDLFNNKVLQQYVQKGNEMLSKAYRHTNNQIELLYLQGKILNFSGNPTKALQNYAKAIKLCKSEDSEWLSILLSTMGIINDKLGNREECTYYNILSMTNDISNAIVESNASGNVAANLFYDYADTDKAFECLKITADNAFYYGSRYRINMLGNFLPMIMRQSEAEQQERYMLMTWTIVALMAFAALLVIILRKNIKTSMLLQAKNAQLMDAYRQLSIANSRLDTTNRHLSEATRLKNQYLGHYMDKEQETINQINEFTLLVSQKLALGQLQPLQNILKEFRNAHDQKAEREDFDRTFTAAFPTFVKEFNELLTPDARQKPNKDGSLTPIMRIYALVRLGITDTKRIARALDYTFNTVYNYRVRIRNKAINPQTFEQDVAQIGL